jgi:hypothetical protein
MFKRLLVMAVAAGCLGLSGAPASARHNDWAAPLVGGALGGFALGSIVDSMQNRSRPQTTYVEPAYVAPVPEYVPVAAPRNTSSIEARLRQLDQLAAGGYISKQEYDARRQAILNGL